MTKEDWRDENIIDGWINANGSKAWPFGDNWRMALINPVVVHAAKMVQEGFRPDHRESLYREIAVQRETYFRQRPTDYKTAKAALEKWHENPFGQKGLARHPGPLASENAADCVDALNRVRILDLGCGEAYRSRWLSRFGIQFLGIDGSPRLIGTAEARRKSTPLPTAARKFARQHIYKEFDLEEPEVNLESLCEGFEPNLVTAITCFDHLSKPQFLIEKLSTFLGKFSNPVPLLVVTLNPRHYDRHLGVNPADTLNDEANEYFGTKGKAIIESARSVEISSPRTGRPHQIPKHGDAVYAPHTVNVYYRSLRDWEQTFTDGNFHVLRVSPLQFSNYTILAALRGELADARVFYEAAPFHAWLLYSKKAGRPVTAGELQTVTAAPGVFSHLNSNEATEIKKVLESGKDQLRVTEVSPSQRFLFPHNLGGDVCVVLRGSAHLTASDGTQLQNFGAGDIIGELETEWIPNGQGQAEPKEQTRKYMIRRYIYSVDAGPDGATLLLVPKDIFATIANVGDMASFAGGLFQTLRDKLLVNVWQFFGERMKSPEAQKEWDQKSGKYPASKGVKSERLQRIAKGIMSLASIEAYNASRDTDGNTIFCGPVELGFTIKEDVDFVARALELFDAVGLIRWYSGELFSIKNRQPDGVLAIAVGRDAEKQKCSVEEQANKKWEEWKKIAFRCLVARPLARKYGKAEDALVNVYPQMQGTTLPICNLIFSTPRGQKEFTLLTEPKKDFDACVRGLTLQGINVQDSKEAARRWLANIGYVNTCIIHSRGTGKKREGQIIRITAPHELRRLAFDENEFNLLFVDRLGAFPEIHARAFGAADLQEARARRYCEIVENFLKTAWENGGDCTMTASTHLRGLKTWKDVSDFERMIDDALDRKNAPG